MAGVVHCVYGLISESDGIAAEREFKSLVDGEPEGWLEHWEDLCVWLGPIVGGKIVTRL